ncbi:MAG TPA: c-type cytochrome [Saprospiraceae bacterium]|nr:c-type cytochrome [Saprospiraceae bacterium]
MYKHTFPGVLFIGLIFFLGTWWLPPSTPEIAPEASVAQVLLDLGDEPSPHYPDTTLPGASAAVGRALFQEGIAAKPGGGTTSKQSRHFVCTSCHNIEREDPDLRVSDPQARLEYVKEKGLPFLQGTALYGAVNRRSFYNGYYEKKYGDLVRPARNDIREAIQLCAIECSQGRLLEDWELESVLAYLWTIDLKMKDLQLTEEEKNIIEAARPRTEGAEAAIRLVKSKYLKGSPATFVEPPKDRTVGYPGVVGDPQNGALIYELSCLHCHQGGLYAFFELDDSKATFKYLSKHMDRYTRYSIYQVTRWGTQPLQGKRSYMPNYTAEKMSRQQLEDLRAYIEQEAGP